MLDFFGLFSVETLYVVLGMAVVIIALLVVTIINIAKYNKLKGRYEVFMSGKDGESLEALISKRIEEVDKLKKIAVSHDNQIKSINEELLSAYEKVGIIRYDAFNEMGGKLSFALAMLDKSNNGFVMNAMHSREGCYTYIKEIIKGESYITLGEEEKKALEEAVGNIEPES